MPTAFAIKRFMFSRSRVKIFTVSKRNCGAKGADVFASFFFHMAGNRLSPKSKFPSSLCFKFEWKTMGPTAKKQNKKKTTRPFSECSTDQTKMDKKSKSTRLSLFSSWILFEWEKSLRMRKSINSLCWNLFFWMPLWKRDHPKCEQACLLLRNTNKSWSIIENILSLMKSHSKPSFQFWISSIFESSCFMLVSQRHYCQPV